MSQQRDFAASLRWWRQRKGHSQLELAGRADISQRHLSFLELGRAAPSRDMVIRLAAALDVPLRQQNALLVAAGFAPVWRQTDLAAPELAQIRYALDFILAQQEPFPAVVVDRHWNLLLANSGAGQLVELLVGPLAPGTAVNLADALVAPGVLRPYLTNWTEVAGYFVRSVEADAAADGTTATAELLKRLLAYDGVEAALAAPPGRHPGRCCRCYSARATSACSFSPRSRRSGRRRTSRCRSCASKASFRWTRKPRRFFETGRKRTPPRRLSRRSPATASARHAAPCRG
ncbi:helix-turn-helix domain-containing protein [Bradyrhizobium elkanii]|uniref:helix-turn-helix domain-containing protein n=1 Tax=Bradyrhizobium elkanii TaxID=29448 RepID=UPI0027147A28|nr:helix-turn-helix domain-containing protein [Bradyrhizobium elkanii]WLB13628.1 helix-turn-helix domain-containing protein [Bradyrhizobium elkanii]